MMFEVNMDEVGIIFTLLDVLIRTLGKKIKPVTFSF